MCKCKLVITLSEEIMIVGRKKDGDGKGNKWNEVNMEILEVSLYRGIVGGKISLYALVTYDICHAWRHVAYDHIKHASQCHAWTFCGVWYMWRMGRFVTHETQCHACEDNVVSNMSRMSHTPHIVTQIIMHYALIIMILTWTGYHIMAI